jgi:putative inorganic carbon (HCO3(-)) transporter
MFAWALVAAGVLTTIAGLAILRTGAYSGGRFGGYLGNPNNLAAVILPGLALAGLMLHGTRRGFERRLLGACGLVLLLSFFLTESRGGLVGLGVMWVVAVAFAGPARGRVVGLVAVLAVAGVAYFTVFAPQSARQRITSYSAATSTGRSDLWSVAALMFENHPIRGVGIDNFTVLAPAYLERDLNITRSDLLLRPDATEVHNTYLNVLAELGLPGELLFLGLLAGVLGVACSAVRTLARAGDREAELTARGLVIGASGMLTAYFFFSAQFEKPLWLVLGALAALSTVARAAGRRQAAGATGPGRRPALDSRS